MDYLDKKLLALLLEDSDQTASELSRKLNLSIPSINKRIAKMRANGVIERYTVQLNPEKIGKPLQAIILLVVNEYDKVSGLMNFVAHNDDVVECYAITGEYDYWIRIYTESIDRLEELLLQLKELRCVSKSLTQFVLREHKKQFGPLPNIKE